MNNNNHKVYELIDFALYAGIIISFFLHHRINGFFVMLLIFFSAFKVISKKMPLKWYKGLLFFPSIFIMLIIGVSYSIDVERGWTIVERSLSLLLLPLAAQSILQMSKKNSLRLLNVLILSAFVFSAYCLVMVSLQAYDAGTIYVIPRDKHFLYNMFMHHRLASPLGLHAVYLSLFIALANIAVLNQLIIRIKNKEKGRLLYVVLFVFFCVMLYLLKSANIGFGFMLCASLALLFALGKSLWSTKKAKIISVAVFSAFIFFAFLTVSSKLETFSIKYDMTNEQPSAIGTRLSIWDCAVDVVKENWLLGTGTGDGQAELRESYKANAFKVGSEGDFNAHNMYLEYWMSNGVLTLVLFLGLLVTLLIRAIKRKNILFLSLVVLFLLFSFTESTMRTQKGMVFFVLLASLFYWLPGLWMLEEKEIEK